MTNLTQKFMNTPMAIMPYREQEGTVIDELPTGLYELKQSMQGFYLLKKGLGYTLPEKLYGNMEDRANKILRAYHRRDKSTGVMLTGDKGCGKTELLKLTANKAIEQGIPVVQINDPYAGAELKEFLSQLGPVALVFDEFAKIYERFSSEDDVADPQADLLSMFDGFGDCKNLNIITENDRNKINSYMRNRPGRFYYSWDYGKLEIDVIVQYCKERGVSEEFLSDLVIARNSSMLFSFDILQAIVAESMSYPEATLKEVVADMNIELVEPKYTFQIKNIDHPLVNWGVLEASEYSLKITNCEVALDPQTRGSRVELHATPKAISKFLETGKLRNFITEVVEAHKTKEKSKLKKLKEAFEDMKKHSKKVVESESGIAPYTTQSILQFGFANVIAQKDDRYALKETKIGAIIEGTKELAEVETFNPNDTHNWEE